ncbi:hypothetical protein GOP47_0025839 [Adiantum capillus-veneris]|uniref:Origin recognition complex subunit 3 N-terminal domain-containing protein n=1 Tax=Adiantum capillus-veneris TaxID=13818 RepID=A0A9D4U235_ADICA|nr:hypothetical protein GOP47_0025839 [Adiantum capillus-veneris]
MLEDPCSDDEATLPSHGDASQACFLLHTFSRTSSSAELSPRNVTFSAKRKRNTKEAIPPLPPCFPDEPQEYGVWRMQAFKQTWMDIETNVKEVFEVLNTKIFKEIQKFVHNIVFYDAQLELYLYPKTSSSGGYTSGNARASKQIHAAFLRLRNVDSSDHTKTFVQLKMHLKKGNCHVANLLPYNFSSKGGAGAPLHTMMKQIVGISPDTADMDILASWHRAESNAKCPIVIIIEDAELCNSIVLAEFIVILSEWIAEIPLVLIMGMTTSGEAIRKLLPGSAARHLRVHSFMFPSPDEYLEGVIGVLLKGMPVFTLGCDALSFLLIQYQKYDSTVISFLRALKMACTEHFVSQPLSFLCRSNPVQTLVEPHLQYASMLPSLQSKQSVTDSDIRNEMDVALKELIEQKERWNSTVSCLLALSSLVGMDYVKIFLEILELSRRAWVNDGNTAMDDNRFHHEHHNQANLLSSLIKKLRDASESTLHKVLTKWIEHTESIQEWRAAAQNILQNLSSECAPISRVEGLSNGTIPSSRMKQLLSSVQDMPEEGRENMALNGDNSDVSVSRQRDELIAANSEAEPSSITSRVDETHGMQKKLGLKVYGKQAASLLEQMIRKHLVPVESLPFHEIICFRSVVAVKEVLVGEPRNVIQQNVEHPLKVLKCECCHANKGAISSSMNDNSILFHLAQKQVRKGITKAPMKRLGMKWTRPWCKPGFVKQLRNCSWWACFGCQAKSGPTLFSLWSDSSTKEKTFHTSMESCLIRGDSGSYVEMELQFGFTDCN